MRFLNWASLYSKCTHQLLAFIVTATLYVSINYLLYIILSSKKRDKDLYNFENQKMSLRTMIYTMVFTLVAIKATIIWKY